MISIVIISKDEASLNDSLADVISQAENPKEPSEVIVVDVSDGRLDHIRIFTRLRCSGSNFSNRREFVSPSPISAMPVCGRLMARSSYLLTQVVGRSSDG